MSKKKKLKVNFNLALVTTLGFIANQFFLPNSVFAQAQPFTQETSATVIIGSPPEERPSTCPGIGKITSHFGEPRSGGRRHAGIDIDGALEGTPALSTLTGTVTVADTIDDSRAGKWVKVENARYAIRILHLDRVDVRVGQQVNVGTPVGAVGSTGVGTGPHIHYEVYQGGVLQDPENFIPHVIRSNGEHWCDGQE